LKLTNKNYTQNSLNWHLSSKSERSTILCKRPSSSNLKLEKKVVIKKFRLTIDLENDLQARKTDLQVATMLVEFIFNYEYSYSRIVN